MSRLLLARVRNLPPYRSSLLSSTFPTTLGILCAILLGGIHTQRQFTSNRKSEPGHSMATTRKNWHATHRAQLTFGQRIADTVAATMGSWSFIIVQSAILTVWIILNVVAWISHWDPYPFILLNLALSFQAAYAAPFILISQNRQAERDRHQAEEDFRTNIEAEQRIEDLQRRLAAIEVNQLAKIIDLLEKRLPAKLAP
jgi:uncharacterized membrane protein